MAYTTAANVRAYMSSSVNADDTLLTSLIARATAWIEQYVGFSFEVSADTDRALDASADVDGMTLYFGTWCASITTVTNGDTTVIASTKYVTEPRNDGPFYAITLKSSSGYVWENDSAGDSEDAITVEGRWGWSTAVPSDIEHATIRMVAWMYHQRNNQTEQPDRTVIMEGAIISPATMPKDILSIFDMYRGRL